MSPLATRSSPIAPIWVVVSFQWVVFIGVPGVCEAQVTGRL